MVISSWSMYLAPKYPYPVSSSNSLPVEVELKRAPKVVVIKVDGLYVNSEEFTGQKSEYSYSMLLSGFGGVL